MASTSSSGAVPVGSLLVRCKLRGPRPWRADPGSSPGSRPVPLLLTILGRIGSPIAAWGAQGAALLSAPSQRDVDGHARLEGHPIPALQCFFLGPRERPTLADPVYNAVHSINDD